MTNLIGEGGHGCPHVGLESDGNRGAAGQLVVVDSNSPVRFLISFCNTMTALRTTGSASAPTTMTAVEKSTRSAAERGLQRNAMENQNTAQR